MVSESDAKRQKLTHNGSAAVIRSAISSPGLSIKAQERVATLATIADCEVDADGIVFKGLHKAYLAGASGVLRSLIESFGRDKRLPLKGDKPHDVALLLSLIYEPRDESLTAVTVAAALRMAHKYDCPDLRNECELFVSKIPLSVANLPHWLALAVEHDIASGKDRCFAFAQAAGNFEALRKQHGGDWMNGLPGWAVSRLFAPQYSLLHSTLCQVTNGLNVMTKNSSKPVANAAYAAGTQRYYRDAERTKATPVHRQTMEAVLLDIAIHCSNQLRSNPNLSAADMQRLLPGAMPRLPVANHKPQ